MKKLLSIVSILIGLTSLNLEKVNSQNLVINPGFESISTCPTGLGQLDKAIGWNLPVGTTVGSTDLMHSCNTTGDASVPMNSYGTSFPRTGNAYAFISPLNIDLDDPNWLYREYAIGNLITPLIDGQCYRVEFWVKRTTWGSLYSTHHAIREIGAYFSSTPPVQTVGTATGTNNGPISARAQVVHDEFITDKNNWQKISGTFRASGGEKYITLGYFNGGTAIAGVDYIQTVSASPPSKVNCGYYFDDVSVTPINICPNELLIEDKTYPASPPTLELANHVIKSGFDVGLPVIAGNVDVIPGSTAEYKAGDEIYLEKGFKAKPDQGSTFLAHIEPAPCGGDTLEYIMADAGDDFTYTCGDGDIVLGGDCHPPNDYHWHAEPAYAIDFLNTNTICKPTLNIPNWAIQAGLTSITYTQVVNEFSCSPSYDDITITLDLGPVPPVDAGPDLLIYGDPGCGGDCEILDAYYEPGYTYLWSPADGVTEPPLAYTSVCYDPSLSYPKTYTVTMTDDNGCNSATDQMVVDLVATPMDQLNFQEPQTELCTPGSCFDMGQDLDATYYGYNWVVIDAYHNGAPNPASTAINYLVDPLTHPKFCQPSSGSGYVLYRLTVTKPGSSCVSTYYVDFSYSEGPEFGDAVITLHVVGPGYDPFIGTTISGAPSKARLTIREGGPTGPIFEEWYFYYGVDYTDWGYFEWGHPDWEGVSCNQSNYHYQLYHQDFCDNIWDTNSGSEGFWPGTGNCSKSGQVNTVAVMDRKNSMVGDNALPKPFILFPNPSNGLTTVLINNFNPKLNYEASIISPMGQLVKKTRITAVETELDLSELSNGVYIINVFDGENYQSTRLVKQ